MKDTKHKALSAKVGPKSKSEQGRKEFWKIAVLIIAAALLIGIDLWFILRVF